VDEVGDALHRVVEILERLDIPYAIGGSLASMAYGEPRYTMDIDVLVQLSIADLHRLIPEFPSEEYYVSEEAARDAVGRRGQFNIIPMGSAVKIDVYVAGDPIALGQISSARRMPISDAATANFSAPEELIIKKLQFYSGGGSEKHLRDIAAMLKISGDRIDRERVGSLAAALGLEDVWMAIITKLGDEPAG
jgi:hypothetical protein